MNIWANAVVTNKGLALQAKLIEGATLTITRAVTGTGTVSASALKQQTAVSGEKQAMIFRPVSYPETGKCSVPVYLTNETLTTGYTIMQIGIYANDPDEGEILYFLCQAESGTGTHVPSVYENPGFSAEWNFTFQYGQADNVNVTVDPANTINATQAQQMIDAALNALSPRDIGAAPESMLERTYSVATFEELDAAINSVLNEMSSHTVREFEISFTAAIQPFGGGTFLSKLYKVGDTYAMVEMRVYGTGSPKTWVRSLFDGVWKEWVYLSDSSHNHTLSDLNGCLPINKGGTGGTTQNSAVANILCRMLINNTSIVDANTLVHTGIHKVYVTDSALATKNHYPYVFGNLFVVSNMESTAYTYIMQTFFTTDGGILVRASTNNGSTWTDWAKTYSTSNKPTTADIGAVNKAGDTMTGTLNIEEGYLHFGEPDDSSSDISRYEDDDSLGLQFTVPGVMFVIKDLSSNDPIAVKYEGFEKAVPIFHAYNKPNGTYTGNGSEALRKIPVGGIGRALLVYGNARFAIVCNNGGFFYTGSTTNSCVADARASYSDTSKELIMKTADAGLNENGKTYYYQVL